MQIDVAIMGQSYKLACKEDEQVQLQQAAHYLNDKMCAIRDAGKIKGNDRIAIIAALGLAVELLNTKMPGGSAAPTTVAEVTQKISAMHAQLDQVLNTAENA